MNLKIDNKLIVNRIKLIELYLKRLKEMQTQSEDQFSLPDNFAIAAYNLRSSLEAVFDICAHILSRIPGAQVEEYKQMALEMGRNGLVTQEFAGNQLYKMAGYRNRLTHLYFEVSPKEMHDIIKNNLSNFETFLRSIKKFLDRKK